jgi:hypothetical protein
MKSVRTIGFVLGVSLSLGTAWADLSVSNPTFAPGPPLSNGPGDGSFWNNGPIPGWTFSSGPEAGSQTVGSLYPSTPDGGGIFAYTNNPNGIVISQDIGTVQATGTYTVSVYVGDRTDGFAGTYSNGPVGLGYVSSIDLVINGTDHYATGVQPTIGGTWSLWSVTVTGVTGEATLDLGPAITGNQADYADVSATPEPGFYGVLALGLAGLMFVVFRRHRAGTHVS